MTTIVHTTDMLDLDRVAFEHSVALALAGNAKLVALHASDGTDRLGHMPDAADVLARWGRADATLHYETRIHTCCQDVVDTVLDGIRRIDPSLVVATAHERGALARLFSGSQAEAIAHNTRVPVLLFPADSRGFLDDGGHPVLRRVLVPVGGAEAAQAALRSVQWLAELLGVDELPVDLLHVGDEEEAPRLRSESPRLRLHAHSTPGHDICEEIAMHSRDASLIVMATRSRDSLTDVLWGSHTDRVLHKVHCSVLSVRY